jgi:hypothetical protein
VPDNPDGRSAPAASSATAAAGTAGIRVLPPAGAGDAGRVGKSANGRRPGGRRVGGSATSRAAPRGHRAAGGWDGSTGTARVRPPAEGSNTDAASVDQRSELWAAAVTVVHRQGWLVRLPPSALHPTSWMHMMIIQIQTAAYGTSKNFRCPEEPGEHQTIAARPATAIAVCTQPAVVSRTPGHR